MDVATVRVKGDVKMLMLMVMLMVMTGDGVLGWISNIYFPPWLGSRTSCVTVDQETPARTKLPLSVLILRSPSVNVTLS